jgi:hypothetical protein
MFALRVTAIVVVPAAYFALMFGRAWYITKYGYKLPWRLKR